MIAVTRRLALRWAGTRPPTRTIRMRLTALYGGLFLASGAALLTVTYILVARQYSSRFFISSGKAGIAAAVSIGDAKTTPFGLSTTTGPSPGFVKGPTPEEIVIQAKAQSAAALHQLLVNSGIALAIMTLISIWLGWLVAGRALRPLRTITNAAREISVSNLHRRLALDGPNDELTQLGNTFDGLLARLENSFAAQRQFVANASHELRTPLTLERTLVEVALADPNADADTLRRTCEQVLAVGVQQERLIEALLTLSRSQRGLDRQEPVDLAAVSSEALRAIDADGPTVDARLEHAHTSGDSRLVERLVANLVDNAVRHNLPHGRVVVETETAGGQAVIRVANTGLPIAAGEVERLFEPFERLDAERTSHTNGVGLGLSIVRAIAEAHAAQLTARPRPSGGLEIEVGFPRAADH